MQKIHIKEIEPLAEISVFPLASGYWLLILLIIAIICSIISYFIIRKKRQDIINIVKYLNLVKNDISKHDRHQIIIKISKIIRFLAIRKFSRHQCAGLIDKKWILWLKKHDPSQFDWQKEADLLIKAPYMQKFDDLEDERIIKIINATLKWV